MSLISAHDLHKSFGAHGVISGVSLTIGDGERLGLVGHNGSGKSTLARILGGHDEPDQGVVMRRRGIRVATLLQVPEYDPRLTAFDTAALGLHDFHETKRRYDAVTAKLTQGQGDELALLAQQGELGARIEQLGGWDQEHQVRSLLEHLAVPDPNAPVTSLSGGEQRRVALAQQLLSRPDLLILDEPTNHLDTETSDWLEQHLATRFPGALLLITHDRYFLDRLVTRTLEMSQGTLTSYDGGWERYLEGKAEREAIESRTEANRQNFLRKEIEWLRRQPKARGTKQKARIDRANQAIDSSAPTLHGNVKLALGASRQGSDILEFQDVELRIGERVLVENLELLIGKRQRVGILGRNGAGKTTLLRAVTGELVPSRGKVRLGKTTKVAYFDQTRSGLDESRSIADNVSDGPKVNFGGQDLTIYSYLGRFLFRSDEIHKKVAMLSGGERARVALAKLLLQDCNLLLLDEPTNDLDVTTLTSLEQMLLEFPGSVIVVTHDRYFLNKVATDILAFEGEGQVVHYVGNYDTYKSLRPTPSTSAPSSRDTTTWAEANPTSEPRDATTDDAKPSSPPQKPTQSASPAKRAPKLSYGEQRELEGMLERIEALETRVTELEGQLGDPAFYREEASRVAEVQAQLAHTRTELEQQMARWEELESKREAFERSR